MKTHLFLPIVLSFIFTGCNQSAPHSNTATKKRDKTTLVSAPQLPLSSQDIDQALDREIEDNETLDINSIIQTSFESSIGLDDSDVIRLVDDPDTLPYTKIAQ